ncbi:MAG: hypothetical protein A3H69_01405 [Candidatus Sungbacteria bacterium RIFCSPLOWO2_02_FULL_47_9]|uniref:Uncharacterized protein n=1 Tax=Candidatus Sungbacteria bacterium RIFCSPHIGHO2_01_FULL_47_32 TaxID=1802264 RepID=A0A1G2K5C9_9BACT|nr:MAG: hypothetical protein A2633_01280 [Candidatus Sungbacteria bacterium RIFCSPHIGHO2_01_FULL_47_32]OGZ99520.1 MAG: hypothetical protein A3D57_00675 [Candidatus Sungbacteria bacterium RIFCSPHIGHO2_02_FULL_46_12]OHA04838.1 MAG: hypothetical protein A3A28_05025 [Candidatus Sungbacteria bacterium RIFCSPLOWO2_01_FULL_47_32]OHA11769.1 MAG: hypothetical protein A3H69_01405 [Candidatus Sungbacteria bacterium RIFCSPLOWO2_02_FULL_47_9]
MKHAILFLGCLLFFSGLTFLAIQTDLYFNSSWLFPAMGDWRWYNYLTSQHGITVLYLKHNFLWLLPSVLFSLAITIKIWYTLKYGR